MLDRQKVGHTLGGKNIVVSVLVLTSPLTLVSSNRQKKNI